jgi:3-phenylpropionate/trans-cinnamate dioxygenase ferredoxin reductase subunit
MPAYQYLIVGGGMAADAAARGIRQVDPDGSIGLISREPDPPYNRPPLSKGLWKRTPLSRIWRRTDALGVELHLNRTVVDLNPLRRSLVDDLGQEYTYERLLLATGGDPIRLAGASEQIIYFRTLTDYQRLRVLAESSSRFTIIGGGFIGSEIAAALAAHGKQVTMLFMEDGLLGRLFPPALSAFMNDFYTLHGIRVLPRRRVALVEQRGEEMLVRTQEGDEILSDGVVAGLGIRPNLTLAEKAGLEVGNGILVDARMQTTHPDIFAAGDVVNFNNPALDQRLRTEHEENANETGLVAGQNMAGAQVEYSLLPRVYSTLFDLEYDAVGLLDPALETKVDWQEENKKGVVYYLLNQRVRGVLFWNIPGQIDAARALITSGEPLNKDNMLG